MIAARRIGQRYYIDRPPIAQPRCRAQADRIARNPFADRHAPSCARALKRSFLPGIPFSLTQITPATIHSYGRTAAALKSRAAGRPQPRELNAHRQWQQRRWLCAPPAGGDEKELPPHTVVKAGDHDIQKPYAYRILLHT